MKSQVTKLARHSVIYGIGSSLGMAGSFLLIPLYTHMLSPAEYGVMELLYRAAEILMLVMMMGVRQAYLRFYFDGKQDEEWQKTVTGTTILFVGLSSLVVILVAYPFTGMVHAAFLHPIITELPLLLVLAWLPVEMLVNIGLAYFQATMRSGIFVSINLLRLALFLGLSILFVYFYRLGVTGVMAAQVLVTTLIAAALLVFFIHWTKLKLSFPLMKEMVWFGLPYLPASFFMYIIANSDRYFLGINSSLEALGVYALAAKIGMVGTMLLMDPFLKVWSPFIFENYKKPDGPEMIGRVVTLFTLASVGFALLISVFTPLILPWISDTQFHSAFLLVPIICLAAIIYSLSGLADAGILIAKKTKYKPAIFGSAAAVALLANAVLIPYLDALGAAIASVLSFTALFLVNLAVSNRFYRIGIEMRRIGFLLLAGIATYLLSYFVLKHTVGGVAAQAGSVLALACFPLLLWASGFFLVGERAAIRQLLRAAKP